MIQSEKEGAGMLSETSIVSVVINKTEPQDATYNCFESMSSHTFVRVRQERVCRRQPAYRRSGTAGIQADLRGM
jgi:hypothetical protein